ncbi:MAG TPA: hypothetical protein VIW94_00560 [Acidimicrobiia bacterium]
MTEESDMEQPEVLGNDPATPADVGELQDTVDDLLVYLHEAKSVPLSGNVLVDRELFLGLLEKLRSELPDELRAARWMVREREAFISRTNEKAREIVEKARAEADELVSESNITKEAVEEANILVRRAEGESRLMRLETEDEIEKQLQDAENLLSRLLSTVKNSRNELHQARPKPPDVPI